MYHTVDEIETAVANLAAAYPTIAERILLPETSTEHHRTVPCLRLGSNAAGAADGALFIFGQHAREWVPPEVALAFAADALYAYANSVGLTYGGMSYTAAQVRQVLDTINVFVVTCVNPDGRIYTMIDDTDEKRLWRKNRTTAHHATCHGVDLNRNYDFAFDLDRYFSTASAVTTYTSDNPCSTNQTYQGPSPFSESETRNVRWLLDTYPRIRWFIDIHGYRGEIYYPFGDDENQTTDAAMNWRNSAYDHQRGVHGDAYREYMARAISPRTMLLALRLREGILPVRGRATWSRSRITLYPTGRRLVRLHVVPPSGGLDQAARRGIRDRAPRALRPRSARAFSRHSPRRTRSSARSPPGLINFCLAASCGVPGLTAELDDRGRSSIGCRRAARQPPGHSASDRLRGRDLSYRLRTEPHVGIDARSAMASRSDRGR